MTMHSFWRKLIRATIVLAATVAAGCSPSEFEPPVSEREASYETDAFASRFGGAIESTHGFEEWQDAEAVATDITVQFGGENVLDGTLIFRTDFGGTRLELASDVVAVYDGETAWVSPPSAEIERARFHLLTWPYFLSIPMKLRDPGARLEPLDPEEMRGKTYERARLTFEPGTGDTPDDWYILYVDPETHRLAAMAYVVTYGTSLDEAEEEPHMITHEDFEDVNGVLLSTSWKFWHWSEAEGRHGDPIGEAELTNVRFVSPAPGTFEAPDDAREAELPGETATD